ncbi:CBS domain-containing protein [Kineosporia babensis]|uniref:CBS domain-containing protein n=1 Tax=Kineosporia babensis TaxID=499548 RepID=A0A9X1NJ57_9ACTN|nr:CBS domain-containing protein [Kineosporia babensis]MCD5315128.1 CBS domain-containing protein [Kineosporia babensis]
MSGTTPADLRAPSAELLGLQVGDVLVRMPKTLPTGVTVPQALAEFDDDHVHMLLLVAPDGTLAGTLVRDDLPDAANGPALAYATLDGRTLEATLSAEEARQQLLAAGQRRRAVVDDAGRLIGLLCLKRRRTGFCSDANVASRAAERSGRPCAPESA